RFSRDWSSDVCSSDLAKTLSIQIDFKSGHAFALSNIGRVYQDMQQYDEAIENFKAAIEIFKQINNKSAVSGRLNDLGEVYTLLRSEERRVGKECKMAW